MLSTPTGSLTVEALLTALSSGAGCGCHFWAGEEPSLWHQPAVFRSPVRRAISRPERPGSLAHAPNGVHLCGYRDSAKSERSTGCDNPPLCKLFSTRCETYWWSLYANGDRSKELSLARSASDAARP